ncbi:MAG: LysE family translocator [Chromatocurvus sp.]
MAPDRWLALAAICLLGAASPGPSLAVVLQSTLSGSRRTGLATALGHGFGVMLYALITVCGLGLVIAELPALYATIRLAGAAYLLWLALQAWTAGRADAGSDHVPSGRSGFVRGATVALLNPKLAIFMLALFSQFLDPSAGMLHGAILITTAGAIDALWYASVALAAGTLRIQRSLSNHSVAISRSFAMLLALLAVWVIATTLS